MELRFTLPTLRKLDQLGTEVILIPKTVSQELDHVPLHDAGGRQQLWEPAERGRFAHRAYSPRVTRPAAPESCSSSRKGLETRSRPIVVCSP